MPSALLKNVIVLGVRLTKPLFHKLFQYLLFHLILHLSLLYMPHLTIKLR